jgi:dipeptidyl aminopeptidase/acylaminoacyl peptidase
MKKLLPVLGALVCLGLAAQNRMTPELLWKLGRVSPDAVSPDGRSILYGITRYDVAQNKGNRELFFQPLNNGVPVRITNTEGSESDATFLFNGSTIGYALGGQYYLMNTDGTNIRRVTNIPGGGWGFKAYEDVNGGIKLLFVKSVQLDSVRGEQYGLPKADVKIYDDLMYRHWDSWSTGEYQHLCLTTINANLEETSTYTDLFAGQKIHVPNPPFSGSEDYLFTADGKGVIYAAKPLRGKAFALSTNTDLFHLDLTTGKTRNLTPTNPGYDTHPTLSPDGTLLAYLSMARDGYESDLNRLAVMNLNDSAASYVVTDNAVSGLVWTGDREITFVQDVEGTVPIRRVALSASGKGFTGRISTVASGTFNYSSLIFGAGRLIALRQDMNRAAEIFQVVGREVRPVTTINAAIYDSLALPKVTGRWIKTSDGKKMWVWVILPPNFDPAQKYPTLLYCQGGPQSAVSQFYSFRWNFQLMASEGYVVVAPNRRGLPGFGAAWNEQISGDWGGQAMQDYLTAIDSVAAEPWVDKENLGCVGASYGGYSVYMLAGMHNKRFGAFISHCGLYNMESWYATTEEMFFANWDTQGTPWDETLKPAYTQFNPRLRVGQWDTPILVIHGGNDFRVPLNQGLEAYNAAQLRGIPSKLVVFPQEGHWILKPQNGLVWHKEFFGWLNQWLKD